MRPDLGIWEDLGLGAENDFIVQVKTFWNYQGEMCVLRLGRAPLDPVWKPTGFDHIARNSKQFGSFC